MKNQVGNKKPDPINEAELTKSAVKNSLLEATSENFPVMKHGELSGMLRLQKSAGVRESRRSSISRRF